MFESPHGQTDTQVNASLEELAWVLLRLVFTASDESASIF